MLVIVTKTQREPKGTNLHFKKHLLRLKIA